jgi:hypothetical protein
VARRGRLQVLLAGYVQKKGEKGLFGAGSSWQRRFMVRRHLT